MPAKKNPAAAQAKKKAKRQAQKAKAATAADNKNMAAAGGVDGAKTANAANPPPAAAAPTAAPVDHKTTIPSPLISKAVAATASSDSKAEKEFAALIDQFEKVLSSSILIFAAEKQLKRGMLELFNPLLAESSGTVSFGPQSNSNKDHVLITSPFGQVVDSILISKSRRLKVVADQIVTEGDMLAEGMIGRMEISQEVWKTLNPARGRNKILIHTDKYHPEIAAIKLVAFRSRDLWIQSRPDLAAIHNKMQPVSVIYKNGKRRFFICHDGESADVFRAIMTAAPQLQLNPMEFYKAKKTPIGAEEPNLWSAWSKEQFHTDYYNKINDPLTIAAFEKHILAGKKYTADSPLRVLDVGGGEARLAEKLFALAGENAIHYIFLEPDAKEMEVAKTKLAANKLPKNCKVEFHQQKLEDFKAPALVDCIISSGGPLNETVTTSRVTALVNLHKLSGLLNAGGKLIATGLSLFVVKSKHFAEQGLIPLSYAVKFPDAKAKEDEKFFSDLKAKSMHGYLPVYVWQKPVVSALTAVVRTGPASAAAGADFKTANAPKLSTSGAVITAAGDKHQKLVVQIKSAISSSADAKSFDPLLKSLDDERNYPQALRQICTIKNNLVVAVQLATILLEYKNVFDLKINDQVGPRDKPKQARAALHHAAATGNQELCDVLKANGAVDAPDGNGDTAQALLDAALKNLAASNIAFAAK